MTDLSHKALCALAVNWLQRPNSRSGPGCTVALAETANACNGEVPDAIGWRPYAYQLSSSVLVEVKTSRADFLADAKKPHRLESHMGMGVYRYYMAPAGLIAVSELPDRWGLVEVTPRGHIKVRCGHVLLQYKQDDVWRHERNHAAEISTLAMCLNRVSDPQKVQDRLRDLGNQVQRLLRKNEDLERRVRDLDAKNFAMRVKLEGQDHSSVPMPRSQRVETRAEHGV